MCATYSLHSCFRQAKVLHLACVNQFLHRAGYVFDRYVRINPMLIQEINCADLEPLERALDCMLDVLRPAVQARRAGPRIAATEIEPELGGDHHLLAELSKGFAHEFFVGE